MEAFIILIFFSCSDLVLQFCPVYGYVHILRQKHVICGITAHRVERAWNQKTQIIGTAQPITSYDRFAFLFSHL